MTDTHYNIEIKVTKVEFQQKLGGKQYGKEAGGTPERRVVSEAGHINIKDIDFEEAKRRASAHLDLLTEFAGSDPKQYGGNLR
jgi:hypothetical protein